MEKLLELLNEYEPYIASDGEHRDNLWGYAYQGHSAVFPKGLAESYIISARYGFIKWLVENDKVNIDSYTYSIGVGKIGENNEDWQYDEYSDYEKILMILAIQDDPIKFLISILK